MANGGKLRALLREGMLFCCNFSEYVVKIEGVLYESRSARVHDLMNEGKPYQLTVIDIEVRHYDRDDAPWSLLLPAQRYRRDTVLVISHCGDH